MKTVVGSLLLACAGLHVVQAEPLEDLRAAQAEYSRRVGEQGQAAAWREFLADDAVLLRPTTVPAREWVESRMWPDGRVTWSPARLEFACSADLAFSAGPWIYTDPQGHVAGGGWSLLLWRRDPAGEEWRIVLEQALDAPGSVSAPAEVAGTTVSPPDCADPAPDTLERAERELNKAIEKKGYRAALEKASAPGLELLRDGAAPARPEAVATGERERAKARAVMHGVYTTHSADLALTHGEFASLPVRKRGTSSQAPPAPRDATLYLRLWRFDGRHWRVVLDSLTATPADSTAAQ
jgi:hypothetical protein